MSRSVSSRRAWADMDDVESEDELDQTRSSTDISSEGWGSGACTPIASSNEPGGDLMFAQASQKLRKKKLTNKPISRSDLGYDTFSGTSETYSTNSGSDSRNQESIDAPQLDEQHEFVARESQMSRGAALHDKGQCKPCLFRYTKLDCRNGFDCEFCHLAHMRGSRNRPCKGKRDRYKKLVARQEQEEDAASASGSSTATPRAASASGSSTATPRSITSGPHTPAKVDMYKNAVVRGGRFAL